MYKIKWCHYLRVWEQIMKKISTIIWTKQSWNTIFYQLSTISPMKMYHKELRIYKVASDFIFLHRLKIHVCCHRFNLLYEQNKGRSSSGVSVEPHHIYAFIYLCIHLFIYLLFTFVVYTITLYKLLNKFKWILGLLNINFEFNTNITCQ